MSRLVELLQKLHKSPAPLGFGLAQPAPARKRMLVIARVAGMPGDRLTSTVSTCADAVAYVNPAGAPAVRHEPGSLLAAIPAGMWLDTGSPLPSRTGTPWDFVVCGPDGPVEVLAWRDTACFVRITAGTEGSRLRATADLGADAMVLAPDGLELERIFSAVECRRIRLTSGKPVLLQVVSSLTPLQVAVLWRAGVDAIIVDATGEGESIAQARAAVDKAPYESKGGDAGGAVSIGAHLARSEEAPVEEREDEGDDDEEEPDDDE